MLRLLTVDSLINDEGVQRIILLQLLHKKKHDRRFNNSTLTTSKAYSRLIPFPLSASLPPLSYNKKKMASKLLFPKRVSLETIHTHTTTNERTTHTTLLNFITTSGLLFSNKVSPSVLRPCLFAMTICKRFFFTIAYGLQTGRLNA